MSTLKKTVDDSKLDEISGGLSDEKRNALRKELLKLIPEEVRTRLASVKSDVDACRLLAENGINIEEVENRIKDAYAGVGKDLLSLTDRELENVSGGFQDNDFGFIWCSNCTNNNRDDFSYQFWVSQLMPEGCAYRCKKCGHYILVRDHTYRKVMTPEEYDRWHYDQYF